MQVTLYNCYQHLASYFFKLKALRTWALPVMVDLNFFLLPFLFCFSLFLFLFSVRGKTIAWCDWDMKPHLLRDHKRLYYYIIVLSFFWILSFFWSIILFACFISVVWYIKCSVVSWSLILTSLACLDKQL